MKYQLKQKRTKSRLGWREFLLIIISLGASLLCAEAILLYIGVKIPFYPPVTWRPELYQEYPPYGYRLWPSIKTTYLYPRHNPRKLSIVSNSYGFRSSREFDETDARTRIIVVGDSFVFGEGVEANERFTNVLETMEAKWRVDSLGMTGYGPDLMLRALEEVGLNLDPEVVIFCMYTDDFRRVRPYYAGAGFAIPRFELQGGELSTIPYPKPHFWDNSRIFQAMRILYWSYSKAEWELNKAILDRFLDLASERHFVPAIIFLPGTSDTKKDKKRRAWLAEYAKQKNTPYLDVTAKILGPTSKTLFIPKNWHYNPQGHYILAREVRSFLADQVLNN